MISRAKNSIVDDFYEGYKNLNDKKKELFSKLCDKLLDENFVYAQLDTDKNDYYDILSMREVIEPYFLLIDYQLRHDDICKILFIETLEDRNRIRLKKLETVILILLRRFYYIKSREEIDSSTNVSITFDDLIDAINQTGIYKDRFSKTLIIDSLRRLKKFKIINLDIENYEINNVIEIYPTINYIVKIDDLELLNSQIKSYINKKGEVENEVNED